ncbi:kainate-selective ionotropic glutamate receptor-like protein 3 [Sarcoptes scabiei]|uniref:Kainate-selective ionotropic glutamate receptor-like protein 3 n=1 Tax=Sarcoptes scabiei TaxID=52283 RepID=A0A132AG30_SARSC|nr:kainate-selective ionotropic glutamate receptor-like protein 3 [Sarcoptes scabiei]
MVTIKNIIKIVFILFCCCDFYVRIDATTALPSEINIGAVFETGEEYLLDALRDIIDRINNDRKILPRTNLTISPNNIAISRDSFRATQTVCRMFNDKIWLLFSSRSDSVYWFARSAADTFFIPHIAIQWDYRAAYLDNVNFIKRQSEETLYRQSLSLNPEPTMHRGPNGGFYMTSASGNAQTGFRWQDHATDSIMNRDDRVSLSNHLGSISQTLYGTESRIKHLTLNVYPDASELSEALKEFIDSRNWKSFTLIYDSDEALIKCKDLLTLINLAKPGRPKTKTAVLNFVEFDRMARLKSKINKNLRRRKRKYFNPRHLVRPIRYRTKDIERRTISSDSQRKITDYVYMRLWKEIKNSEHNFILSMNEQRVIEFLREARKLKRMSEYDNFFVVTMDLHLFNLSEFQFLEPLPNITALSLLNTKSQDLKVNDLQQYRSNSFVSSNFNLEQTNTRKISTLEALVYDSMILFARALDDLDRSKPELITEPFVDCRDRSRQKPWPLGLHIIDFMKNLQYQGITGPMLFNDFGFRINFTLDVLQLKNNGLKNVAVWSKLFGIKSYANYTFYDSYREILEAMKFKELLITAPVPSIPYISLREDHELYHGNEKYHGYCVDLLKEIANVFREDFQSDFKYVIKAEPDGQYGRPDPETGEWNGMFGELIRHQADLAIADLTATYLRETAVDFTMPFMNLGITILFKKPSAPEPEMFSFLKPFSVEVWIYLASAFLGISLLLWILSRISPYEWQAPHSCDPEPIELVNQFSIGNSLWFTIGSLMQQGSDLAPRALSTRTLATIWWFFTLIIISSYTANLAASLTLSRMAPAISSVEDLAKQTSILYGCRKGGSTHEFFANSNNSFYQRMYNTMEANPEVYINKITDAIERVRKGGYAYLAESSTIEYLIQRRCDLIQIGNWLDNKGYGIATPPDSPYRTPISNAITVLQDRGILYQLKKRWWVEKGGGLCTEDAIVTSASELDIQNVGGVFLVLAMGVAFGVFSGFIEFIWKSLKLARDERESLGRLIWLEMFRICTGVSSSRPVFQTSSPSTIDMTTLNNPITKNSKESNEFSSLPRPLTMTSSLNSQYDYLPTSPFSQQSTSKSSPKQFIRKLDPSNALSSSIKSLNKLGERYKGLGSPISFKSQQPYS